MLYEKLTMAETEYGKSKIYNIILRLFLIIKIVGMYIV